ncbi:MAG: hypothetical protein ABIH72_05965 [archaeon]
MNDELGNYNVVLEIKGGQLSGEKFFEFFKSRGDFEKWLEKPVSSNYKIVARGYENRIDGRSNLSLVDARKKVENNFMERVCEIVLQEDLSLFDDMVDEAVLMTQVDIWYFWRMGSKRLVEKRDKMGELLKGEKEKTYSASLTKIKEKRHKKNLRYFVS